MSVEIVGEVLQQVLTTRNVWNSRGDSEKVRGEISSEPELKQLAGKNKDDEKDGGHNK